ncbi:unnamed protein product [Musa textilis]
MCKGGIVFQVITPWFCTTWVINICSTPSHGLHSLFDSGLRQWSNSFSFGQFTKQ